MLQRRGMASRRQIYDEVLDRDAMSCCDFCMLLVSFGERLSVAHPVPMLLHAAPMRAPRTRDGVGLGPMG